MHRPQLLRSQSISRTVAVSPTTASNLNSCMQESSELRDSRLSKSLTLTERQQISLLTKNRKKTLQRKLEPSIESSELARKLIQEKIPKTSKKKTKKPKDRRTLVSIWLPVDFESWETNRQKAWKNVSKNPDAYYFSYAKPGLEIFKKAWTANEKEKFCRLLKDRPPNDKWGLFSMHFPHRTGSQCKDLFLKKKARDKASRRRSLNKGRDKKKRPTKSVLQVGEASHIKCDNKPSLLRQEPDLAKEIDQSNRMNSKKNDVKLVSKSFEETRSLCIGSQGRETSQHQDESAGQVKADMNTEEATSSVLTRVQPIEKRQLSNQSEVISDSAEGFTVLGSSKISAANSIESEKGTCGGQQQEQSATVAGSNERSITALEVLGISMLEKLDEPMLREQTQSTATCLLQSGEKPTKLRKLAHIRPMKPSTDGVTAGPPVVIPEFHCQSGGKQQKQSVPVASSGESAITAPEDVLCVSMLDKLDEAIPEEPITSFTSCADKEFISVLDSQLQERTELLQQEDKFESERTLLRKRFELDHQRLMHHFKWRLESIQGNADEQSRLQLLAELADEFKQEQTLMVRLQKIQSECLLIQSRNAALLFPSSYQPQAVAVVDTVPPFW